jgi:hypothetical protein
MQVITLVNVGRHSETLRDTLTEEQKAQEPVRPERLPLEKFAFIDRHEEQD